MSIKDAKASNWVAERADTTATSFDLKGSTKSYTTFSKSFSAGQTVFYSAHDEDGNREAGYGEFDGSTVITRNPTATLVSGIYEGNAPSKVDFTGEVTVACTFNASAFNTLWAALDAIDPDGDGSINIPPELINGLIDSLNSKAEQADLEKEIQDRIDGDKALQDQIDVLDPDGDRKVDWSEIEGKPTEFPPSAHQQGWDTITGKPADYPPSSHGHAWGEITGKPTEFPPSDHNHDGDYLKDETDPTVPDYVKAITTTDIDNWNASGAGASSWDDLTGKPTEFPPAAHNQGWDTITGKPSEYPPEDHIHEQKDVDGLELRLEAIEDSITSGGGFVDAPNNGKLFGRQSEAWAEVVIPEGGASSWDEIADKPDEFPPSAHNHEISEVNGLPDALNDAGKPTAWDDVTGKPTEFPPEAHNQSWSTITDKPADYPPSSHGHAWGEITGKPTEFPPEDHKHVVADITDFDPADYQPVGDYATTKYVDDSIAAIDIPDGGGSSVHIGENPPTDPQEGQQWMEVPASGDATMWIYDGGKWLQQPGGKDGAAGADGADGNIADGTQDGIVATWDDTAKQWTPDSSLAIDASGDATFSGKVGIGAAITNDDTFSVTGSDIVKSRVTTTSADGESCLFLNAPVKNWGIKNDAATRNFIIRDLTGARDCLTIDAAGDATFTGNLTLDRPSVNGANVTYNASTGSFQTGVNSAGDFFIYDSGNSSERLNIDATGNATFSGTVNANGTKIGGAGSRCIWADTSGAASGFHFGNQIIFPCKGGNIDTSETISIGGSGNKFNDGWFAGTVNSNFLRSQRVIQDGSPVIDAKGLIKTLSTLRNATKDETTLEGLRDSIGNAIGGLIEEFENQIAEMPAEDEA